MTTKNAVIRCPIHGSIPLNQKELRLIDSPFCQRLRNITQLGFTSFVFPGAVHTRFSHSIGAMHLAGRVFDNILSKRSNELTSYYSKKQLNYFRQIVRFAALVHDVGHAPFSHAAEVLLPPLSSLETDIFAGRDLTGKATHEDFSQFIVDHLARNEKLITPEEAEDIIGIMDTHRSPSERMMAKNGIAMIYPLLRQLINGEIDVDRMDYLLRDSYFAGVPYGRYDLDRLVDSLSCQLETSTQQFLMAIDGEGVPAYEIFLLARTHMFYQIYFHKSLGAYRHYLKMAFQENEIEYQIDGSLENFLYLTETRLMEDFQQKRDRKWSGRIFYRVPAKTLIRVLDGERERLEKLKVVQSLLQEHSMEVISIYSSNQFSSQVEGQEVGGDTVLAVEEEFGKTLVTPLAEKSSILGPVEKLIEIHQLYVHREDYQRAIRIINDYFSAS